MLKLSSALLAMLVGTLPVFGREVSLHWLDTTPPAGAPGVSFGVPWSRGEVKADQNFTLTDASGKSLPLQHWTLAYWPDGSIKWTGFAAAAAGQAPFTLSTTAAAAPAAAPTIHIQRGETGIVIDTGKLLCRIPFEGDALIDWLAIDNRQVARDGRLVCLLQDGPDTEIGDAPRRETFTGHVEQVTIEQSGPVRAVVKIAGHHVGGLHHRTWLPFVVRLYFYAGQSTVRIVHSIIFDGDQNRDFIRALGLVFGVPLREEAQNRTVRFSGENAGLWSEPVQPLVGRGGRFVADPDPNRKPPPPSPDSPYAFFGRRPRGVDVFPDQMEGKRVPNRAQVSPSGRELMDDWAVWDDFKLMQPNADGFTIVKRTNPESTWLAAGAGRRASGLAFIGDVSGGLGVSIRNFWQSYPASLEVRHASTGEAQLCAWLWSPDAPCMDLRHYDIKAHGLDAVYEDVQPGFSTAHGVARTSELTLFASASIPTREESAQEAEIGREPALLVCSPADLHRTGVFGLWSLPDRSTPLKSMVETQLNAALALYEKEVEQRHWYGFWDFGNIMHSYDPVRHVWRYDLGGMAWDNTELASDMWLWYSYLRTGRPDLFRLAEAETRNTSEVDVYHLGPFAGLGSRHNVIPWGDGAKEARISQAAWKRFYYYLTTDERVGDLMDEVVNVDEKALVIDPMRLAQPPTAREKQYPARVRAGPDWFAFVGNWMTKWERTNDPKWRDKIYAGMDCLAAMPYGIRSGKNLVYGYDPNTGKLYRVSDELGDYNLATIQGGPEVIFELNELIDNPPWKKTWLQYCRLEEAPADVIERDRLTGTEGADASYAGRGQGGPRLAAYAYAKTGDAAFAQRAIAGAFAGFSGIRAGMYATHHVAPPEVLNPIEEAPRVSTNGAAQSSLTAIEVLALCADRLPDQPPAPPAFRGTVQRPRPTGGSVGDQRTPDQ